MNSSRHISSKAERLDLALRSGALGDVAGILADMSPGTWPILLRPPA